MLEHTWESIQKKDNYKERNQRKDHQSDFIKDTSLFLLDVANDFNFFLDLDRVRKTSRFNSDRVMYLLNSDSDVLRDDLTHYRIRNNYCISKNFLLRHNRCVELHDRISCNRSIFLHCFVQVILSRAWREKDQDPQESHSSGFSMLQEGCSAFSSSSMKSLKLSSKSCVIVICLFLFWIFWE